MLCKFIPIVNLWCHYDFCFKTNLEFCEDDRSWHQALCWIVQADPRTWGEEHCEEPPDEERSAPRFVADSLSAWRALQEGHGKSVSNNNNNT